jgi:hypothetical protein
MDVVGELEEVEEEVRRGSWRRKTRERGSCVQRASPRFTTYLAFRSQEPKVIGSNPPMVREGDGRIVIW